MITKELLDDLIRMRYKAEIDPAAYKRLKDMFTHGIPCDIDNDLEKSMYDIFDKFKNKYGLLSSEMMSLMKVGVGIEFSAKEVAEIYLKNNEIPPAYDLSLRARCYDENVIEVMNSIIGERIVPDHMKNTLKFIERCKYLRRKWEMNLKPKVGRLRNGSATRLKYQQNIVDITGVVFRNSNYKPPENILNRLGAIRKSYWDYIDATETLGDYHGSHFIVPGKECKVMREVYAMDPEEQLDGKIIADYLRYIAKAFDTNATLEQYRWIWKCIGNDWNNLYWIISTDMEKYSDSLNREYSLEILSLCGIIDDVEKDELNRFWGSDVWDRDRKCGLHGSDSVKQGQYSIFDMMTIINMFLQCVIYDLLKEDIEYRDEDGRIRNMNSALGDDTVLAAPNEHPEGLDLVQAVFGYMGVKISQAKTHQMSRGYDYRDGLKSDNPGFVDFAKRIITKDGLIPYVSTNAIMKDNFDDYVMEYFRIRIEDEELAEEFGQTYLGSKFLFIKNLHKINGGMRTDEISDDDMILFEYKMNKLSTNSHISISELNKQLDFIERCGVKLSNSALLGWLPGYDGDDMYIPNDTDDLIIRSEILNFRDYGRSIDFIPSDYIGMTWDQVKDDENINSIMNTIRINEKENTRPGRKSKVYWNMSELNLSEFRHNLFIFDMASRNEDGTRDFSDMKLESTIRRVHETFRRCCNLYSPNVELYEDKCWYCDRWFVRVGDYHYRLYNSNRPKSCKFDVIPRDVFKIIMKDVFINHDKDELYDFFIRELPFLSRDDEYYCYFG